jgi:DNA-binding response OmpR family regulator
MTNTPDALRTILVVDDEPELRSLLEEFLSMHFKVETRANGLEAIEAARSLKPDVILMDVMMPGLDGISTVGKLREDPATRQIPVLLLTGVDTSTQRIRAFDLGADDFIAKPFVFDEVLARVRSRLVRVEDWKRPARERYEVANLVLDPGRHEVTLDGAIIELGPFEFGILSVFMKRPGLIVTRREIMLEVWGDDSKNDRLIDAHLTSLRKKLAGFKAELKTVYGEGFILKPSN